MIAGIGAGLVLAPVTGVILAGIRQSDAGAASRVLATAQQIGAAAGIAIAGILSFGQLHTNAMQAVSLATPRLHAQLTAIGLPAPVVRHIESGFSTCFNDRASQSDPTATPPSCARIQQQVAVAPLPVAMKAQIGAAINRRAVPLARKDDFTRSLQHTLLFWQIPLFISSGLLVFALQKVKTDGVMPVAG